MSALVTSDYSGLARSFINPASMVHSRKFLDVYLAGGSVFAYNNYLYIPANDYSPGRLRNFNFPVYPESGKQFLDDYNTADKNAFVNLRATGPSAMINVNRHSIAFQHNYRLVLSADRLPFDAAKFMLEGLDYEPQQNIRFTNSDDFTIGSLGWAEAGISYAYMFYKFNDVNVSAGITLKRLWAYHGIFLNSSYADYMTPDSDTLIIYRLDASGGFSLPLNYGNNNFQGFTDPFRGRGFAFDIGISWVRTLGTQSTRIHRKICEYPYEPYLYRIGLSLLDFGRISFDRNLQTMLFSNIDTVWTGISSLTFENLDAILGDISAGLGGSPDALLTDGPLRIALPSAISLQFDYNFQNNFIVNALIVQDLPLLNNRIARPSYISIAPRYSTRLYEVSLPFSLYRYREPRLGAAFRYMFLTVGTENLGGFLGFSDFYGLDFYFAVQLGLFKGDCGRRFGGIEQCPSFN